MVEVKLLRGGELRHQKLAVIWTLLSLSALVLSGIGCALAFRRRWRAMRGDEGAAKETKLSERRRSQGVFRASKGREKTKGNHTSSRAADLVRPDLSMSYNVPFERLVIGMKVAAGASGQVYSGEFDGQRVAIKELFATLTDSFDVEEFRTEASWLATLHHPNIVYMFGICEHEECLYIVMEWCPRSVASQLDSSEKISHSEALRMAAEIAEVMSFLHSKDVAHRDLKPANVLLNDHGVVKLCDFGLSRKLDDRRLTNNVGMMAEDCNTQDGRKLDVYAFAVLLNALFASEQPYAELKPMRIIAAVMLEGLRPKIAPGLPDECAALVRMCWLDDPALRPNFAEISRVVRELQARQQRQLKELGAEPRTSSAQQWNPDGSSSIPCCAGCNNAFVTNTVIIHALDLNWHQSCFVCAECKAPFGANTPYIEKNGKAFCPEDYRRIFATRSEPGRRWHEKCFVCSHCCQPLGEEPFVKRGGGLLSCMKCAEALRR